MSKSRETITVSFDPPTEHDWDSYGAVPTTEMAKAVVHALAIVPTVNGGVQFELHVGGVDVEIEFDEHGQFESLISARAVQRTKRVL